MTVAYGRNDTLTGIRTPLCRTQLTPRPWGVPAHRLLKTGSTARRPGMFGWVQIGTLT